MNEVVIKNDAKIEDMIHGIRGKYVMLDSDLAILYESTNGTKDINKAVILSGFTSIKSLVKYYVKFNLFTNLVMKYEKQAVPLYYSQVQEDLRNQIR